MKSEFKEKNEPVNRNNVQFPVLAKLKGGSCIVLFKNEYKGTVVYSTDSMNKLGEFYTDWDFDSFILLKSGSTVKLFQESLYK